MLGGKWIRMKGRESEVCLKGCQVGVYQQRWRRACLLCLQGTDTVLGTPMESCHVLESSQQIFHFYFTIPWWGTDWTLMYAQKREALDSSLSPRGDGIRGRVFGEVIRSWVNSHQILILLWYWTFGLHSLRTLSVVRSRLVYSILLWQPEYIQSTERLLGRGLWDRSCLWGQKMLPEPQGRR